MSAPASETRTVVVRHSLAVRVAHVLNIPILLGLTVSGLSIYWASPLYRDAAGHDRLANIGVWVTRWCVHGYPNPEDWFYNVFSLGTFQLASALRLHWLFVYLFTANGLLYAAGLLFGGGWRALVPRRSDVLAALRMVRYYIGYWPARLFRHPWAVYIEAGKYNPLQRLAYLMVALCGALALASGWAMHKPAELGWLAALLGGYERARVWHFWVMWLFVAFTVPHIVLVLADGWDTLRSMLIGWSEKLSPGLKTSYRSASSLRRLSRQNFLLHAGYWVGVVWGLAWVLPPDTWKRMTGRTRSDATALNRVLDFDDEVAEALYSPNRQVPTFDKSLAVQHLKNNYNGVTPDPAYIEQWHLEMGDKRLSIQDVSRFPFVEQVTRLVCVEGWSAIAWWGGIRLSDFMAAYPPPSDARYIRFDSDVNLDSQGNSDPYYVSIDIPTALHPQTLLATHWNGQPLTVEHGAPLRLVAPMKLGLKNIKAITRMTYTADKPPDYWHDRGYSDYDGV